MLLEKTRSKGDVYTFKLSSGEEIVARFEEDCSSGYKVSKPMMLSMSQQGVGMMPFLFTVNPNVEIEFSSVNIIAMAKTDEDFAKQYLQATTGIRLA